MRRHGFESEDKPHERSGFWPPVILILSLSKIGDNVPHTDRLRRDAYLDDAAGPQLPHQMMCRGAPEIIICISSTIKGTIKKNNNKTKI